MSSLERCWFFIKAAEVTDGKHFFVEQPTGEEFHLSFQSFSVSALNDDLIVCLVSGGCC
jgi:hypothetical protein